MSQEDGNASARAMLIDFSRARLLRGEGMRCRLAFSHVFATPPTRLYCTTPHARSDLVQPYTILEAGLVRRLVLVPQAAILGTMALAACSIAAPVGDLKKVPPIGHLDLTERERERELDKYASPVPVYLTVRSSHVTAVH